MCTILVGSYVVLEMERRRLVNIDQIRILANVLPQSTHFAMGNDGGRVTVIRVKLLEGLTVLMDRRASLGSLKYPDHPLYIVFARMERVFSSLSTPTNFTMFRG